MANKTGEHWELRKKNRLTVRGCCKKKKKSFIPDNENKLPLHANSDILFFQFLKLPIRMRHHQNMGSFKILLLVLTMWIAIYADICSRN